MKYIVPQRHLTTLPVLILAGLLLCAQLSTIEHGIDHLSHDTQELCKGFTGFEKSSPITNTGSTHTTLFLITGHGKTCKGACAKSIAVNCSVRAPPYLT